MRSYWAKILLGAVAIFGVGYGAVWVVRTQVARVKHTIESADPIRIPLAFVPFVLDGAQVGTLRGLEILRTAPKSVSEVHIRVRAKDDALAERFAGCRLTTLSAGSFDPAEGFRCLAGTAGDSALIPFGDVTMEFPSQAPVVLPLLLDSAAVADLSDRPEGAIGELGRQEGEIARAQAESAGAEARRMGDSIRAAVRVKVTTPR
jgi:hypothetical protein